MARAETEEAPGLIERPRRNGASIAYYWAARTDLIKLGYRPKVVRLHYETGDPLMAARCRSLQKEMLAWSATLRGSPPAHYDGTFASLVRFYETHPDSPFHDLGQATARTYEKTLANLMQRIGARRVAAVDGSDVRRWYKELADTTSRGWAYYTINVLKAALSFGATKRLKECRILRVELREARFQGGKRRKERLTYPQIVAFREAATAMELEWMGLCLTLQFAFGLRRRDVIGHWIDDEVGTDGIRRGRRVWRDGLTWGHIDAAGILRKLVSKTAFTSELVAVHAIADYPDVEAELAKIQIERRVGPIVINSYTGLPPNEAQCRYNFRRIARAAGIPDEVWNMDARAGAVTEAYEAGATEEEGMALATHSERSTNRGYLRDLTEQSRSAARKRVASRKE